MEQKRAFGETEAIPGSGQVSDQVKDWAKSGPTRTFEAAARGKDAAAAIGSEAASSAGSAIETLRAEVKSVQDMVTRLAAQYGQDAVNSARGAATAAAGRVGDVAGDLAQSGANAAAAAGEQAKSLASGLEGMARRNPMGFLAGAVVIGVAIGMFGRRT